MTLKTRGVVTILAMAVFFLASIAVGSAKDADLLALDSFQLTGEQLEKIGDTLEAYIEKEHAILSGIETKLSALTNELRREGRFDSKRKERKAARNVNTIVKDITSLYGQLIRTKVEYILKIKNVLTEEQRVQLVHSLQFDEHFFDEALPEYVEMDELVDALELTTAQLKKIIGNRTDMLVKEVKIVRDIQYRVLDLEEILLKDETDTEAVDSTILEITDLGTKLIDNKIKYQLKSKDVLTAEQKKKMMHLVLMISWPSH